MSHTPDHRKPCTLCAQPRDVLVRCQIDSTGTWHFVCPGTCWKRVSGGVVDGDADDEHKYYKYGGMWKNKHEAVSAKMKKGRGKRASPVREHGECEEVAMKSSDEVDMACVGVPENTTTEPMWQGAGTSYAKDDRVSVGERLWVCRKDHQSQDGKPPHVAQSLWKELRVDDRPP